MNFELALQEFEAQKKKVQQMSNNEGFVYDDDAMSYAINNTSLMIGRHFSADGYEQLASTWGQQVNYIYKAGYNNSTKQNNLIHVIEGIIGDLQSRKRIIDYQKEIPAKSQSKKDTLSSVPKGMTKRQKESLTQKIHEADLTLEDFRISVKGTETIIEFRLEPQLYFLIDSNTLDYDKVEYHHSRFNSMFSVGGRFTSEFKFVLVEFEKWLIDVIQCKHEVEAPDPWNLLLEETGTGNQFEDTEEQFTPKEKAFIKERLDILEKVLAEQFDLHEAEIETLKQAIASLKTQLEKLDKPIWKRVAKTIVIDTVKDIAKNPDKQHSMIEKIRDIFEGAQDIVAGFLN